MEENKLTIRRLEVHEWSSITQLKVTEKQKNYIESSAECLHDAVTNAYRIKWNFYGIYLENVLVGFAMHGIQKILFWSQTWLDRFMIDERYQGKGYGKMALELVKKQLRKDYGRTKIYLSVHKENHLAIKMYEKSMFKKTVYKDSHGEVIMTVKQ